MKKHFVSLLVAIMMMAVLALPAFAAGTSTKQQVYTYLTNTASLSPAAACGIMANIEKESNFNPTAASGDGGYGLCQWTGSRRSALNNYCSRNGLNRTSVSAQLSFLLSELRNTYPSVYNTLRTVANTVDGAYNAGYRFCYDFERPANKANRAAQRGALAKNGYYPAYGKTTTPTQKTTKKSKKQNAIVLEGADAIYYILTGQIPG